MYSINEILRVSGIDQMGLLLEKGVRVSEQDLSQNPDLYDSIYYKLRDVSSSRYPNRDRIMQQLLQAVGVNIQSKDRETFLHHAVSNGDLEIVKFLLENGAALDIADKKGETPLHKAIQRAYEHGHLGIVKLLLEAGAKSTVANKLGDTPLHQAAYYGRETIAELLLDDNARVDVSNVQGETPLHQAACHGHLEVVKLLLKSGASVDATDKNRETPLQQAVHAGRHTLNLGYQDTVVLLLEQGASINHQNKAGTTPLHEAAYKADREMVALLLARGANPDIKDGQGEIALNKAERENNEALLTYNNYQAYKKTHKSYEDLEPYEVYEESLKRGDHKKHQAIVDLLSKDSKLDTRNKEKPKSFMQSAKDRFKEATQSSSKFGRR